jgi:hypothetical protein
METIANKKISTNRQMKLHIDDWQLVCNLQLQVFILVILKNISSLHI